MLRGARGAPVQRALELQLEVGKFYGARRFVTVTNVHMMGDIEVMGDGGLEHLRGLARAEVRCAVPTTTKWSTTPDRLLRLECQPRSKPIFVPSCLRVFVASFSLGRQEDRRVTGTPHRDEYDAWRT